MPEHGDIAAGLWPKVLMASCDTHGVTVRSTEARSCRSHEYWGDVLSPASGQERLQLELELQVGL